MFTSRITPVWLDLSGSLGFLESVLWFSNFRVSEWAEELGDLRILNSGQITWEIEFARFMNLQLMESNISLHKKFWNQIFYVAGSIAWGWLLWPRYPPDAASCAGRRRGFANVGWIFWFHIVGWEIFPKARRWLNVLWSWCIILKDKDSLFLWYMACPGL